MGRKQHMVWGAILLLVMVCGCIPKKHTVPSLMGEEQGSKEVVWLPYHTEVLNEYEDKSKIVYVTADWCLTCVLLERSVLLDERVLKSLLEQDIVAIRADWTQTDPEISAFMEKYEESILPLLVYLPKGKTETHVLSKTIGVEDILHALSGSQD
jgi:thiol:disulfide interchange protein